MYGKPVCRYLTDGLMPKRLILFDIDGTLLLASGVGRRALGEAMLEIFGTASQIDTHPFGGKTDYLTLVELLRDHGYDAQFIWEQMPVFEQAAARHLTRLVQAPVARALPGAIDAIHALRHDPMILIGLVTGNCASTAPIKLRAAGFDPAWFPIGAYGSESLDRNALPALALERAIAHTGCTLTPENITIIGDTVADIACARAVGARAIAVCTGYTAREDLIAARPDHLLDDLTTLLAVL